MVSLSLDNLCELIKKDKYSFYKLTNILGTETYKRTEDNFKINSNGICDELKDILTLLPQGDYKIELKKQAQSPDKNSVIYRFTTLSPIEMVRHNVNQMSGISLEDMEKRINNAIGAERQHQQQLLTFQLEKIGKNLEIEKLKEEIKEIKKNKSNDPIDKIANTVSVIGIGLLSKLFPETEEILNNNSVKSNGLGKKKNIKRED